MNHSEDRTTLPAPPNRRPNRAPLFTLLGFAIGLGAVGSLWWASGSPPTQTVALYWLTDAEDDIYYVIQERAIPASTPDEAIASGLQQLIEGSADPELLSAIPKETRLLDTRTENSEIFVDFSSDFASGGGATSTIGRVTQVLYTATSLDPEASLWILVDGEPVEVLSGEGLLLEQPLTRESFPPSFKNYVVPTDDISQALEELPLDR
ncbi:GerMN domain-containing protein [Synechococcus sp. PCC 7336]|uniref:GerMN domain-containing protein n=1 Tax=Synechococcus sp. PCC 7336 TaxID=195250 RepID=UPI00034B2DC7|nr:GerMN domain-containing protein [Synechococcus sp. PCC 7336]